MRCYAAPDWIAGSRYVRDRASQSGDQREARSTERGYANFRVWSAVHSAATRHTPRRSAAEEWRRSHLIFPVSRCVVPTIGSLTTGANARHSSSGTASASPSTCAGYTRITSQPEACCGHDEVSPAHHTLQGSVTEDPLPYFSRG